MSVSDALFEERLWVPLRWWVQATLLIASLWLALIVAVPGWLPWLITGLALVAMAALFISYSAEVVITADELRAGRAHINLRHVGTTSPLDSEETRRLAGVDADARAFLLVRPYLGTSVRVEITDPADPAPYWLLSSRRPTELAQALSRANG
jgi:hypothetical protein